MELGRDFPGVDEDFWTMHNVLEVRGYTYKYFVFNMETLNAQAIHRIF
jgi:hypothetical protein